MCDFCGEGASEKRYRLIDWCGRPTELGAVLENLAEIHVTGLAPVCSTCRKSIIQLKKLGEEFTALKETLKGQIINAKRRAQGTLRSRSPSQASTGISPCAKKQYNPEVDTGAKCTGPSAIVKELFPKQDFLGTCLQSADHTSFSQSPHVPATIQSPVLLHSQFLPQDTGCVPLFSSFEISQSWSVQQQSSQLQPLHPRPERNTKSIQQVPSSSLYPSRSLKQNSSEAIPKDAAVKVH